MNGEGGILKTMAQPYALLCKKPNNKYFMFNSDLLVVGNDGPDLK